MTRYRATYEVYFKGIDVIRYTYNVFSANTVTESKAIAKRYLSQLRKSRQISGRCDIFRIDEHPGRVISIEDHIDISFIEREAKVADAARFLMPKKD